MHPGYRSSNSAIRSLLAVAGFAAIDPCTVFVAGVQPGTANRALLCHLEQIVSFLHNHQLPNTPGHDTYPVHEEEA